MKKGFTLIELLGVIALLSIVSIIAYTSVNSISKNIKENLWNNKIKLIENAGERWGEDNINELYNHKGKCVEITVNELLKGNYITSRDTDERDTLINNITNLSANNDLVVVYRVDDSVIYAKYKKEGFGCDKIIENLSPEELEMPDVPNEEPNISDIPEEIPNYINRLKQNNNSNTLIFDKELDRASFESINIMGNTNTSGAIASWDVGAEGSEPGSVMAWYKDSDNNGLYELYIGQDGGVVASSGMYLFYGFKNVKKIAGFENLDTSYVTAMTSMFYNCNSIEHLDLSKLNTTNVIDMHCMFYNCNNLTNLNLNNFDTSKVKDMSSMFNRCMSLTNLNVSMFDTTNVTTMYCMFALLENVSSLDVSSFNTANVENMHGMFEWCFKLQSLNLSNFNTAKVTDMSYMFSLTRALETLTFGNNFDTSQVTTMAHMFDQASSLKSIDLSRFNTASVLTMEGMFSLMENLESIDLSSFNTAKVKRMSSMFSHCKKLEVINLSSFDTSNVTNMGGNYYYHKQNSYSNGAAGMFNDCTNLKQIIFGDKFVTNNVTNMSGMFNGCKSLTSLDLSKFDTSNVTNMSYMFKSVQLDSLNICSFDTSKVTEMIHMFSTSGYKKIYVGNNWVVNDDVDVRWMYYNSYVSNVTTGKC